MSWRKRLFLGILLVWQCLFTTLLTLAGLKEPVLLALAKMVWGLNLLWIGGCGLLTWKYREEIRRGMEAQRHPLLLFVLFVTGMAMLEEAVTTLMTNCAPLFGVRLGEVYITASANYLDVVSLHSVVVLVPQFVMWAWLLSRYAFPPFTVMLLYGLTGFLGEAIFAGQFQPLGLAQWLLVYGLMIYLPAYSLPRRPTRRPVRWWLYPCAVILPLLASIPVALVIIKSGHPGIHFPPIKSLTASQKTSIPAASTNTR